MMYENEEFSMGFARIKSSVKSALADVAEREAAYSNRCNNCSTKVFPVPTLLDGGFAGVDRIKIGIPFDMKVSDWKSFLSNLKKAPIGKYGRSIKVKDFKTGTRIEFFVWPGANTSVIYLDFNPSRYVDPQGVSLIHPHEVKTVVTEVIQTYFSNLLIVPTFMQRSSGVIDITTWDPDWKSQISVSRLDASLDFMIPAIGFSPSLLSGIRAKRSHGTYVAFNDSRANFWSNILKSQDGRMTFYDKYEQSRKAGVRNPAPKGTFRFEYRMELNHLRRNHIHSLADLSEDRFEAALRNGWDLSRLSSPLIQSGSWKDFVRESNLSYQEKAELIGYLEEDDLGHDGLFPAQYRKKMRAKARSIGLNFRNRLEDQFITSYQLDLNSRNLIRTPHP
jgi:hypothetical protein